MFCPRTEVRGTESKTKPLRGWQGCSRGSESPKTAETPRISGLLTFLGDRPGSNRRQPEPQSGQKESGDDGARVAREIHSGRVVVLPGGLGGQVQNRYNEVDIADIVAGVVETFGDLLDDALALGEEPTPAPPKERAKAPKRVKVTAARARRVKP